MKLITAGPTAKRQGASFSNEFHPDHPNILLIQKDNPVSTCQNDGKINIMNPIKKTDGLTVKNQYDEVLFDPLSLLKNTEIKAKIVTIKAIPRIWSVIWLKFDFLIFLASLYSLVRLFP